MTDESASPPEEPLALPSPGAEIKKTGRDQWGRDADGLTLKERLFVEEIQVDWNRTQAAIRAGYSPKTAKHIGSEMMTKPKIADAVTRAMASRIDRTKVSSSWVLSQLVAVEKEAAADASKGARKDRLRALELIGKHVDVRAFRTQIGLSNPEGGPIRLWDLSKLDDEELEHFERLLAKVSLATDDQGSPEGEGVRDGPGGEGGEEAPSGEGEV